MLKEYQKALDNQTREQNLKFEEQNSKFKEHNQRFDKLEKGQNEIFQILDSVRKAVIKLSKK